ncbi:MAG TPA: YihY/virulence factor BrkB family protein, partial [Desulfomonilaceae bacterium]|nr:YihY/virulence factor BrkB family protein [Desulfomonilaceae bacterium]
MDVGNRRWYVRFPVTFLHILILSLRGFLSDNCSLRASALTLSTLLSIVPMIAVAFAIAKGFDVESAIQAQIMERLKGQEEVARWLIDFAYSLLRTTKGGVLAGFGIAALFFTVIRVLRNIEQSFNAVWKTKDQRTIPRTISDYLAVIVMGPILLTTANSLSVLVSGQLEQLTQGPGLLEVLSPLTLFFLHLLPYSVIWLLFTFLYLVLPNTKVPFLSGLMGGIIAGTAYLVFQWLYIFFQIGVSNYNAIYGSFAALPLFLVWLQISWTIVLFGAELCYAHQNVENYAALIDPARLSWTERKIVALYVLRLIIKNFESGQPCCTISQTSRTLKLPRSMVQEITRQLLEAGLVVETNLQRTEGIKKQLTDEQVAYQPASPLKAYTLKHVVDALEQGASQ